MDHRSVSVSSHGRTLCPALAAALVAVCVLTFGAPATTQAQALDDPQGYAAVAKWKLNDSFSDGITDSSNSGGFTGYVVTPVVSSSDTPANPDSGMSAFLYGGYISQGGGPKATFFAPTSSEAVSMGYAPQYDAYSGSETVSLWIKIPNVNDDFPEGYRDQGLPLFKNLPVGQHWTAFYHGASRYGSTDCTTVSSSSSTYPDANVHGNCRNFAVMVEHVGNDVNGNPVGHIRVGGTQGGAFLFSDEAQSGCTLDVADNQWNHVVAVYSADAYANGFGFNVTLFINGELCYRGLIPKPYTDVSAGYAHWMFSEELVPENIYSAGVYSGSHHLVGWVDDVRVYSQVLGQPAVTWLKNNSGR